MKTFLLVGFGCIALVYAAVAVMFNSDSYWAAQAGPPCSSITRDGVAQYTAWIVSSARQAGPSETVMGVNVQGVKTERLSECSIYLDRITSKLDKDLAAVPDHPGSRVITYEIDSENIIAIKRPGQRVVYEARQ